MGYPLEALLQRELDRRRFLLLTGGAGLAAYLSAVRDAVAVPVPPPPADPVVTFQADIRRARDFLSLHVDGYNLDLDTSDPALPVLKRKVAFKDSFLAIRFAPQGLAEQAFLEPAPQYQGAPGTDNQPPPNDHNNPGSGESPLDPGDVDSRLAGRSTLSFVVPAGATIPYTYAGILDWAAFAPKIVPVAASRPPLRGAPVPKLRAPEAWETALEIPWWLLLSPNEKSGWAHADKPVEHDGRVELWHTRLGVLKAGEVDELDPTDRTIRGIWSRDPGFATEVTQDVPDPDNFPFRMSLNKRDRHGIVRATADYTIRTGPFGLTAYTPEPAHVDKVHLSLLGAWVDVSGAWNIDPVNTADLILEEWRHKGALGRDGYVRVVEQGALCSPGHRSSLIKVTERKVQQAPDGKLAAYLRQQFFVVVRQQLKLFGPGTLGQQHDGRRFPFDEVRITTLVTPPLLDPTDYDLADLLPPGSPIVDELDDAGVGAGEAWVPHVAVGVPFRFHVVGTDKAGRRREATVPLVFIAADAAFDAVKMPAIINAYNALAPELHTAALEGDPVALAEPANPAKLGDTDVELLELLLGAESPDSTPTPVLQAKRQPLFFPIMQKGTARLAAAEQASGGPVGSGVDLEYFDPYVTGGLGAGEVFAKVVTLPELNFATDKSGGVIQPNFTISSISRKLGPAGGNPATLAGGTLKPAEFFGAAGKLLGGVLLKDIVADIIPADLDGPKAMKLATKRQGDEVVTELAWQPELGHTDIFDNNGGSATMSLQARIVSHLTDPDQSTFEVRGDLRGFALNLFAKEAQFIRLEFTRLAFRSEKGRSAEIDVDLSDVVFLGVLGFVQKLQEFVPFGGEGPSIELSGGGITAKLEVPLPSLEVGVFALSNVVFGAGMTIPFDGSPVRARFNFSKRDDPFVLQVSFFAGGGFFALALGADGVELVEASLEAGARASLDIGVASGSVEAMLGIYFAYGKNDDGVMTTVLTGYVRLRGELDIIELVSLTVEFYLAFSYVEEGGAKKVVGEATVTVTVEVLVFSGDVTMTVHREFAGGGGGGALAQKSFAGPALLAGGAPTFADQISPTDWETWCNAFAAVPA
jgi:hypothetical protein